MLHSYQACSASPKFSSAAPPPLQSSNSLPMYTPYVPQTTQQPLSSPPQQGNSPSTHSATLPRPVNRSSSGTNLVGLASQGKPSPSAAPTSAPANFIVPSTSIPGSSPRRSLQFQATFAPPSTSPLAYPALPPSGPSPVTLNVRIVIAHSGRFLIFQRLSNEMYGTCKLVPDSQLTMVILLACAVSAA